MKRKGIIFSGDFDELVLLAVKSLGDDAYGAKVRDRLSDACGRDVSIGSLYYTIGRLEEG